MNPRVGDVPQNLEMILGHLENAKRQKCQGILFPELAVIGYPPRDLLDYPRLYRENQTALETIRKSSSGLTVIVGALAMNQSGAGKKFYNSAFVYRDQKEICGYHKRLLPSYDIFEEDRFFEAGTKPGIFDLEGQRFGLAICEDIWNRPGFLEMPYPEDPLKELKDQGLRGLFVLSASPFEMGKPQVRERLVRDVAQALNCPVFFCNQVGANDELIFDGSSLIANAQGEIEARASAFKTETLTWESEESSGVSAAPASAEEWLWESLVLGVRDYFKKTHQSRACIGLSGGIDSSVAAVVAVAALGKENVWGVSLPSRFTSSASREDARTLAQRLGISFQEISIEPVFQAYETTLAALRPSGLTLENLQPRIRMAVLMALCNEKQLLLLNTSNKSEIATGYSTLYGDSAGALAPLGDLTKTQVRNLAQWCNRSAEILPLRVIERAPSAELRPDQKDEDSLPPYAVLDVLVDACLVGKKGPEELQAAGFEEKWVSSFAQLHRISEFKRHQFPPVLRVSAKAFGSGRRIPITSRSYTDK